ncbi:DNA repair protein RecO [Leucobacter denitrificans]|uniref:DNA repair protein RecO n=1 Tax=Leucobacter denitrificans TaxID=683042 RepID=A0A7G9S5Q2_9MICO|nr:DNA repair protein RecO [Leucobacter denitrificans]QNN63177.1 DNA repair protein RecO [Leucobacter denitrificans]
MALYRETGVVLRTQKLGEADRIITMFTRGRGILRAVAKGVRRTSSKFGARLEPFMVADLQCFEGRTLDTITQAETLGAYGPKISLDYEAFRAGNVIAETAERIGEGDASPEQFVLLVGALRTLAAGKIAVSLVRDGYLLRAMSIAGWTPGLNECVKCGAAAPDDTPHQYFSVPLGGVVCDACRLAGIPKLDAETVLLLRALLAGDWETAVGASKRSQDQATGIIAAYTQWHLERGLRTLSQRNF